MNRVEKIWRPCEDNPKYEVSFDGEVRNKKRGNILKKKLHYDKSAFEDFKNYIKGE